MANLDPLMTSARTGDSEKDEWQTPKWLYDLLNREFHFNLDPAATHQNALCANYYTEEVNGLIQPWYDPTFVNPPYSNLYQWVRKGYEEAEKGNATVVMLVPARTDTRAWWNYVRWGEVRFLPGRLKFEGGKHSAPFPSAIVIFQHMMPGALHRPSTFYWDIRAPKGE